MLSQHLIHHSRTISRAKAGMPIVLDTLSKEFSAARDRAAAGLKVDLGKPPPTFHEMRSLSARLHTAEGLLPSTIAWAQVGKNDRSVQGQPRSGMD